ncbi:MAG: substrate-binding domain-containing protein [Ancrocorticia sp.]|nr:substrate-binding domain-containing protein [Ancrocorticia sp.]
MIELTGISSMATRHVLKDLAGATEAAGIAAVEVTSIGGVTASDRIAAGEPFDIAILDLAALEKLALDGHIQPATMRPLVISNVGIAVAGEAGDSALSGPAFADAQELAAVLLDATGIGYSTGPSGKAVVQTIRNLGIYDSVADRLVQARPGVPVASLLASGDVSIGFQQVSEILGQPGIQLLGLLPSGLEISSTFSAVVTTVCADSETARAVLDFWDSPEATIIKSNHHFTTNGASCEH